MNLRFCRDKGAHVVTPPSGHSQGIFLLTDDQDLRLGSIGAMPFLREHVLAAGTNLTHYFVGVPTGKPNPCGGTCQHLS